jgi:hypothetical protein
MQGHHILQSCTALISALVLPVLRVTWACKLWKVAEIGADMHVVNELE